MALLNGVGQFMSQQMLALAGARLILVSGEKHMISVGERPCAELIAQARGFRVAMDTDIAEIGSEPWLHIATHVAGERLAAGGLILNR